MSKQRSYKNLVRTTVLSVGAGVLAAFPVVTVLPAMVSHAEQTSAYVTLSSFSGHPGKSLTVSGGNYKNSEIVKIMAVSNGTQVATTSVTATASGEFSGTVALPVNLAQGAVTITAAGQTSGVSATNSYYVTPFTPSLTANSQTTPYMTVKVSGSGYAPNESVTLTFAGATATAKADQTGAFTGASIVTPSVPAASYTIVGAGVNSGASATSYVYVNGFYPNVAPTAYYVMPATSLGFNGSGFAPNETVRVSDAVTGAEVSTFTTDATGSFKNGGSFTVPASYAGASKTFALVGATSRASTSASVTIGAYYPDVTPSVYYVMPGKAVGFNGSGFVPGETVSIYSGTTKVGSAKADQFGGFKAANIVTIPASQANSVQTFSLVGETSKGTGTVSVQVGGYNVQASPSGYYVLPGSILSFSGSGYAPSETILIMSGTSMVGSFSSNADGAFKNSGNVTVGYDKANGSLSYSLVGAMSKQPISFTIGVGQMDTMLTPSSYYVLPYSAFDVTASGFAPNESITLKNGTTVLATVKAAATGTAIFSNLSLPYSELGSASLVATGATSGASTTVSIGMGNYFASLVADNYYTQPGTTVTMSGNGFAPNETVTVTAGSVAKSVTASAKGEFTTPVVLPFGQTKSSLDITATGELSRATSTTTITLAPFNVDVAPSTWYAQPGTPISFKGSGFVASEKVAVTLNGTLVGTEQATATGALASKTVYTLPYGKSATFVLTGQTSGAVQTLSIGLAQFYAGVQLSSYYGNGGSVVTASGSGFTAGESVTIKSGATVLATVTTSSTGAFSKAVTMPYAKAGDMAITATGATSGAVAATGFTVAQVYNSIELGSYGVPAGKALTIKGSGYFANEPIVVTTNRTAGSATITAGATGMVNSTDYILPVSLAEGELTLTFKGVYSFTTHTITMYVQDKDAK